MALAQLAFGVLFTVIALIALRRELAIEERRLREDPVDESRRRLRTPHNYRASGHGIMLLGGITLLILGITRLLG
jgi:hypothetical protein